MAEHPLFIRMDIRSAVSALIAAVQSCLPVVGNTHGVLDGVQIAGGWPKSTKKGSVPMKWLLDRSPGKASVEAFLWSKLEYIFSSVRRPLQEVKRLIEQHDRELSSLKKPFDRFLKTNLFHLSFIPAPSDPKRRKNLLITPFPVNKQVMLALQQAASDIGLPTRARNRTANCEPTKLREERDKFVYEQVVEQKLTYKKIRGEANRTFPAFQIRSDAGVLDIARRYRKRHDLDKLPARYNR
jgi:hypothetical protein